MSSREHILELSRRLEKAKNKSDESSVLCILQSLTNVDINIALLKESDLGKKVNTIRKSHSFKNTANIKETAQKLISRWKELVTAEKKALKKSRNGIKKNKKEKNEKKILVKSQTNENENNKNNNVNIENNVNEFIREEYSWQTGDSNRDKMISKFVSVLKPLVDSSSLLNYMKLAVDIEAGLHDKYGANKEQFFAKYRDLHYNLKKNQDLKEEVLLGMIKVSKLVSMSSEKLANKSLKAKRDKDKKWAMEEARNDHGLNVSQAMTDEYKCGRCKQRKCKYSQAQTRSADEPMTTFVTCLVCGNRWRF